MTKADTLKLVPGTMVFCTVNRSFPHVGKLGWRRFREVRPRDGFIKIDGFGLWCPPFNFELVDDKGRDWSKASEF